MKTQDVEYLGIASQETYIQENSNQHNCYSYAIGLSKAVNPGDCSIKDVRTPRMACDKPFYGLEEVASYVDRDLNKMNVPHRIVQSPEEKKSDEYIVALKVSDRKIPYQCTNDYHFARQLADGSWVDKPGRMPSRHNAISGTDVAWGLGDFILDFYNSKTIFFAISDIKTIKNESCDKAQ